MSHKYSYGNGSKLWHLVNIKIDGIYGCSPKYGTIGAMTHGHIPQLFPIPFGSPRYYGRAKGGSNATGRTNGSVVTCVDIVTWRRPQAQRQSGNSRCRDMVKWVKTKRSPVVHIKIAGIYDIYGCELPTHIDNNRF